MQTNPGIYSGVIKSTTAILRQEGIPAFWKGAAPTAVGMALENAMAFGVNEALKRAFPDESKSTGGPPSLVKPFVMGAITGCCSAIVLLPSEIVKAKLQIVVGKNVTTGEIMKEMIKKQGYSSFATGLDAQLARDASFYGVFFGGYELFCYLFKTHVPSMPDELNYFISGGLAGCVGWTVAVCRNELSSCGANLIHCSTDAIRRTQDKCTSKLRESSSRQLCTGTLSHSTRERNSWSIQWTRTNAGSCLSGQCRSVFGS